MRWVKWSAKRRRKTCSTRSSASSASGSSLFLLLEDVRDALGRFVHGAGRVLAQILYRLSCAFTQVHRRLLRSRNGRLQYLLQDLGGQVRGGNTLRPAAEVCQMDFRKRNRRRFAAQRTGIHAQIDLAAPDKEVVNLDFLRGRGVFRGGAFVRAAGRGLDIFQQFAQVISLQAALEGDLRPQDVDFFDVNFVGKDRAGRHTDAHRADSNRRLGLESLGVADEQAFQLPGPGQQGKGRAVQLHLCFGDLGADRLDTFLDDGPEEIDAGPHRRDEQHQNNDDNSDDQLFHRRNQISARSGATNGFRVVRTRHGLPKFRYAA